MQAITIKDAFGKTAFVLKYSIFAAAATGTNLFSQYLLFKFFSGKYLIYAALIVGTLTGLIVKYLLDKKYIFRYKTIQVSEDLLKFFLYSIMGIFTTIIFWGFELGFHFIFKTENAKFIGAAIGLTIGYFVKYRLDRRYVFYEKKKN